MASHNTGSDAANTNVRAFLTKIGVHYYGKPFNHTSGKAKELWREICEESFDSSCAYCGIKNEKLTMEHLVMFNRSECGLHHPGNVVPCCPTCNKRKNKNVKDSSGKIKKKPVKWEEQLKLICNGNKTAFSERKTKIEKSIMYNNYPKLTKNEKNSIRVMAMSLYELIKQDGNNTDTLYKEITKSFTKNKK